MLAEGARIADTCATEVSFDASPWGGGAVLWQDGAPTQFFCKPWPLDDCSRLGFARGKPAGQTTAEYFTLLLCLDVWGEEFRATGLKLVGDNVAALGLALSLGGLARALNRISGELAWRRARCGWRFLVAHIPSELNTEADALSRTSAPGAERRQAPALSGATERSACDVAAFW